MEPRLNGVFLVSVCVTCMYCSSKCLDRKSQGGEISNKALVEGGPVHSGGCLFCWHCWSIVPADCAVVVRVESVCCCVACMLRPEVIAQRTFCICGYFSNFRLLKVAAFVRLSAVGRWRFFYRASADLTTRVGHNIEHMYAVACGFQCWGSCWKYSHYFNCCSFLLYLTTCR